MCAAQGLKPYPFLRIRTKADTNLRPKPPQKNNNETQFKEKTKTTGKNLIGTPKSSQDLFPNTLL